MNIYIKSVIVLVCNILFLSIITTLRFKNLHQKDNPEFNYRISLADTLEKSGGDLEKYVEDLSQCLKFQTTSNIENFQAFEGLLEYLESSFPLIYENLEVTTFEEYGIVYHWPVEGSDLPEVLLLAHLDVVPVENASSWDFPAFGGEKDSSNEFMYGRGALDDKGVALSMLSALDILLQNDFQPTRPLYLAVSFDEESRGEGAKRMRNWLLSKKVSPFMTLDEGGVLYRNSFPGISPDVAVIGVNEKAGALLNISIACTGGHVSFSDSWTCGEIVADAITQIRGMTFEFESHSQSGPVQIFIESIFSHSDWLFHRWFFANFRKIKPVIDFFFGLQELTNSLIRTKVTTSVVKVGQTFNVKPKHGWFLVDVRRMPGESLSDIISLLTTKITQRSNNHNLNVSVDVIWAKDSEATASTESIQFELLKRLIKRQFGGNVIVTPYVSTGGTDLQYYKKLSGNTFNFTPFVVDNRLNDLSRLHGRNERIAIDDYRNMIIFFADLVNMLNRI